MRGASDRLKMAKNASRQCVPDMTENGSFLRQDALELTKSYKDESHITKSGKYGSR
jgi:hypothetical protein